MVAGIVSNQFKESDWKSATEEVVLVGGKPGVTILEGLAALHGGVIVNFCRWIVGVEN